MSDKNYYVVTIMIYIVVASTGIALYEGTNSNYILGDVSYSINDTYDFSEQSYDTSKISFSGTNANIIQDSGGIGISIPNPSAEAVGKFDFSDSFMNEVFQNSNGTYTIHITKTGNERIMVQFANVASLVNPIPVFVIENNNIYYGQYGFFGITTGDLLAADIGNSFDYGISYDESNELYRAYINGNLIKIVDLSGFHNLFNFYNIANIMVIYDDTVRIATMSDTANINPDDIFGTIGDFLKIIAAILIWNIEGLPWFINLVAIKLPVVILLYEVTLG